MCSSFPNICPGLESYNPIRQKLWSQTRHTQPMCCPRAGGTSADGALCLLPHSAPPLHPSVGREVIGGTGIHNRLVDGPAPGWPQRVSPLRSPNGNVRGCFYGLMHPLPLSLVIFIKNLVFQFFVLFLIFPARNLKREQKKNLGKTRPGIGGSPLW